MSFTREEFMQIKNTPPSDDTELNAECERVMANILEEMAQTGKADNLSGCEVLLHDWAVSRLMSELKKGEAHSESEWIPEEDILEEFGVAL